MEGDSFKIQAVELFILQLGQAESGPEIFQ